MKKRSTKEIKLQAKKALQGHVGTVILGLLAVYGLNTLGTILSTNLFSGTSALDLVLSEVFMLVVSLIVGIISAGLGYMLLNISRGKEFSLGDLGYFFKNQPDRVIVAGFVLALIQLVTAIPYYYVSFTTDPGLTVDSQIQWLSMTLGLLAVSTLLNFLISLPFAMTYFLMADDTELGGIQALKERKADEGKYLEICEAESQLYPAFVIICVHVLYCTFLDHALYGNVHGGILSGSGWGTGLQTARRWNC